MPDTSVQTEPVAQAPAQVVEGLTLDEARDWLDWLEAHGINNATVEIDASDRVAILLKY